MPASPRILFVHNALTTFIRIDLELLRERYRVTELALTRRHPGRMLAIPNLVAAYDLVFAWFASWHTLLPLAFARLLRKPSLLVVGGYDLANLPEIGYGNQRGGLRKWVSRLTMNLASRLMTNSHYSREEASRNAGISSERLTVLYHGLPDPFGELPPKGDPLVLTVGNVKEENFLRKGLLPFVQAAALLPKIPFVLAGGGDPRSFEHLHRLAPANLTLTGRLDDEALQDTYRRATIYVQASLHEGFGMSVAEAMLAGCIPVVTRTGALPEVVGDCGFYIDTPDPERLADAIRQALNPPPDLSPRARNRILIHFPLSSRADGLYQLIENLLDLR